MFGLKAFKEIKTKKFDHNKHRESYYTSEYSLKSKSAPLKKEKELQKTK